MRRILISHELNSYAYSSSARVAHFDRFLGGNSTIWWCADDDVAWKFMKTALAYIQTKYFNSHTYNYGMTNVQLYNNTHTKKSIRMEKLAKNLYFLQKCWIGIDSLYFGYSRK